MAHSVPACSCVLKGQVAPPAEGTPSPLSDHQEGQWEEDELSAINPPASSEASSVVTKLLVYFRLLFNLYFLGQPWFYLTFKINQVFVRSPKTHLLIPPFGGWSIQEKKKKKKDDFRLAILVTSLYRGYVHERNYLIMLWWKKEKLLLWH